MVLRVEREVESEAAYHYMVRANELEHTHTHTHSLIQESIMKSKNVDNRRQRLGDTYQIRQSSPHPLRWMITKL